MKKNNRYFYIQDIDSVVTVDLMTRKEILSWLDSYIDGIKTAKEDSEYARYFCADDESFDILYKDGSEDYIDSSYDGHHIKRQNIESIVYSNPCSYGVFGHFNMNEYGCAYATAEDEINEELKEIDSEDYSGAV